LLGESIGLKTHITLTYDTGMQTAENAKIFCKTADNVMVGGD